MNLPLRFRRAALAATIFLIALSLIAPAIAAADTGNLAPITTMPAANDTSLASIAANETGVPLSALHDSGTITLFRFEVNNATFPGPRDMAFGPRYIELKTNPATLVILIVAAAAIVSAVLWYRKRKKEQKDTPED